MSYELLDCGHELKLERFGQVSLIRPAPLALWTPKNEKLWRNADATFSRERGWQVKNKLPSDWNIQIDGLKFKLKPTDFGHLGIFPEHSTLWNKIEGSLQTKPKILNLFAYSGSATIKAASCGAHVTHVDAAAGMIAWAKENAHLNNLVGAPIRWIVDDVNKFLAREIKRGATYDGIILDPPTFGRGKSGEVFKIEKDLLPLLHSCQKLLSANPLFLLLTSHTPGLSPLVLEQVLESVFQGQIDSGEILLGNGPYLPSGTFALWNP